MGAAVGLRGLVGPVQAAQQVGAGRVQQVVAVEEAALQAGDQLEAALRSLRHRHRDGAVQLHHR